MMDHDDLIERDETSVRIYKGFAAMRKDIPYEAAGQLAQRVSSIIDNEERQIARSSNIKISTIQKILGAGITASLLLFAAVEYLPNKDHNPAYKTYSTTSGQRANVILADGSRVVLAPATTIQVAGRQVKLKGEAVFTVNQNAGAPFTVQSGDSEIRVLGTTFGVSTYDGSLKVAVQDGKVSVHNTVLAAGDVASIRDAEMEVEHKVNVANLLSWTSGYLVFNKVELSNIAQRLERWYGVPFVITDAKLARRQVTASFHGDTPPFAVAQSLAATFGLSAKWKADSITLDK